jgi:Protein of unknown function (DUF2934)
MQTYGADELEGSMVRSAGMATTLMPALRKIAETMLAELASPVALRHLTAQAHIRQRAYYLWEKCGRPDGRALEFWFAAEQEFYQEIAESEQMFWSGFSGRDPMSAGLPVHALR